MQTLTDGIAIKGIVRGNRVIVFGDALSRCEGAEVIVTVLDKPKIPKNEKLEALKFLRNVRHLSNENIDCKAELARAREEKYESLD